MPSKSAKQARFMRAVANSPKFAKKVGVSQAVGKEYEAADRRSSSRGERKRTMKGHTGNGTGREAAPKRFAKGGAIDGCAKKGRTRATMVKMARGGRMKGCK